MKNKLITQLEAVMPKTMEIPKEIRMLYEWIEQNGFYKDFDNKQRWGFLYPEEDLKKSWTDTEREGGTEINFYAENRDLLKYWFGADDDTFEHSEIMDRLCVFAQTGAEGSMAAFWLNDEGETKIVHMGSGSGSVLSCVLAENTVDFLRLLAIGYDEICWDSEFPYPPNYQTNFIVKPNKKFQQWVCETFKVEIPKNALEIVKIPATLQDETSEDEFFNWFRRFTP